MSKDLGDAIGTALGKAAREAAESVRSGAKGADGLSGMKGVVAGAGLAALAPLAVKGAGKLVNKVPSPADAAKKAGEKAGEGAKEAVGSTGGIAGKLLPSFGGGDGDGDGDSGGTKNEATGVGKGRRMPIQQAVDVAVPIDVAYNQWTQFEEWPSFMHRLQNVSQEDESHVSFKTKIWGISKEFEAEIVEQRPDERIKWKVTNGVTHNGVVSFHKLSDRLTRIEVSLDVEPGSLIEKAGRGMRHVKRAVRADLHRFKAYVEMEEDASGEWRGTIEEGEVKKKSSTKSSSSRSRASTKKSGSSSGSRSKASSSRSRSSSNGRGSSSRSRSSSNGKGSSSGSRSGGSSRRRSSSKS
jgi:uncharacterized membrane protein